MGAGQLFTIKEQKLNPRNACVKELDWEGQIGATAHIGFRKISLETNGMVVVIKFSIFTTKLHLL